MEPMVKATKDAIVEYLRKDAAATDSFVVDTLALLLTISPDPLSPEQVEMRGSLIERASAYMESGG